MIVTTICLVIAAFIGISKAQPCSRPRALVYRGPAVSEGCPEAVAHLLRSSPQNYIVDYAGPNEETNVNEISLKGVQVFAFPGGPDLKSAYEEVKHFETSLQEFVRAGGNYLGFCLGAYLAGNTPGFGLLPNGVDVGSEAEQPGSQVGNDDNAIIQVDWTFSGHGQTEKNRWLFFQEGAYIKGMKKDQGTVIARYSKSGDVAGSVTKYGSGWVGLIGPHPEADETWYSAANLTNPDGIDFRFGYDFIKATTQGTEC